MSPLVWAGIAIAAFLAVVGLWAWLLSTPRVGRISKSLGESPGRWIGERQVEEGAYEQHVTDALDVIAEPDRRRAEHMNRTLRRAEGGDEL